MSAKPVLTIAVPTYNGAKTIRSMLDLLLPQVDERVEVLISDNSSTDETPQILMNYQKCWPFIRVIRNEKNIGPDANFLSALRLAKGNFVLLLSDDDILIEDSLAGILDFLEHNPDLTLAYLHTVGFHNEYRGKEHCITPGRKVNESFQTTDKKCFMEYAGFYWGFMSSFLCSKKEFDKIENPERFFGTYWLQSYICILCSKNPQSKLGVVAGPCIGAGSYLNLANFDTSLVDGVYYRKMLDFAVQEAGYDAAQMNNLYIKRICILGKRAVMKEKAAGTPKTNVRRLVRCTIRYPYAWLFLYPFLLIPAPLCKWVVEKYRKYRKASGNLRINRPE